MGELGPNILASSIVVLVLITVMGVVASVMSSRKAKAQKQFFADLHANLAPGKRVMFAGGLMGTVAKVDGDVVEVRVKDGTVLEVSRYAIQEIVSK